MKKISMLIMCFLMIFLAVPVLSAEAAKNYEVVFRGGSHGTLSEGDGKKVVYNIPYGEGVPMPSRKQDMSLKNGARNPRKPEHR